jgi:hypothetical protein
MPDFHVYKPLEAPDVEVEVDGEWWQGEARMRTTHGDGRRAAVVLGAVPPRRLDLPRQLPGRARAAQHCGTPRRNLRKVKRGFIVLLVALACVVLPAAPASAEVVGSTSGPTVVLYNDCRDNPISYAIQATPDVSHWNMEIDVLAPDGTSEGGTFLSSYFDTPTGTFTVLTCGSEMPGVYTVVGTGEYEGADGLTRTWQMAPSTFLVRAAHTKTRLTKKSLGQGRYSLRVSVKDERPAGYFATDTAKVRLERLDHGKWRRVPRVSIFVSDGKGSVRVSTKHFVKVRAKTVANYNYESSTSRPVTLLP